MAGAVANLMVRAGFDGAQLTRGLQQMQRGVQGANNSVRSSMKETDNSVRSSVQSMGSALGSVKALYATAVTAIGGYIGSIGVSYDAMQESSTVAWTTLLGSQEKAKKQIQDIATFAKNTQFDTEGVDAMAKYLNNAGYEGKKLFDQLNRVADVSGAFNISADNAKEMVRQMSQVDQAQVAYTQDLDILQNQGIPIFKAIAKELGTNVAGVRKMASQGKITSEIYDKAFNQIADTVKGSSAKQAATFTGMISTMKDDFAILMGVLEKPIFNALHDGMTKLLPVMDALVSFGKGDMQGFQQSLESTFGKTATNVIMGFASNLQKGMSQIGSFIDKGKLAFQALFDFAKGDNIPAIDLLTKMGLSPKMVVGISNTVIGIRNAIVTYFSDIVKYWQDLFSGKNNLSTSFISVFNTIKSIAMPILSDVVNFIKNAFSQIKDFWDKDGATITQAIKDEISMIADVFKQLEPVLKTVWDSVKTVGTVVFNDFIDTIKFLGGKMNWVMPILSGVVAGIVAFKIINTIIGLIETWQNVTKIMTAAQWLLNAAMDANPIGLAALAIGGLIAIGVALYQNWDTVSAKMSSIWGSIQRGASDCVNGIIGGINWMIEQINKLPGVNIPLLGQVSWGGSTTQYQTQQARNHNHGQAYAYANGTDGHPGGLALVGDGLGSNSGSELFMLPNGKMGLTPSTPTFMNLPKGTQVVNAKDTRGLLKGLLPAYADGIGSFGDWIKGKINGIKDSAVNMVTGGKLGSFVSLPKALVSLVSGGLFNHIKESISSMFSGGSVSGNVMDWLQQALQITGAPMSWLGALSALVQHESGGDPHAINLWDSNAQAGHPSKGLMQTIDSTFNSFAISGLGDIWNPVANAVAGIRYIMATYGDITNVPGIRSMMSGGSYVGYATGTGYAQGGLAMVGENGPELMHVPRGSQIKSNLQTKHLFSDGLADLITTSVTNGLMHVMGTSKQSHSGDIILNLEGREFARIVKPWLDLENKRVGTNVRLQSI